MNAADNRHLTRNIRSLESIVKSLNGMAIIANSEPNMDTMQYHVLREFFNKIYGQYVSVYNMIWLITYNDRPKPSDLNGEALDLHNAVLEQKKEVRVRTRELRQFDCFDNYRIFGWRPDWRNAAISFRPLTTAVAKMGETELAYIKKIYGFNLAA